MSKSESISKDLLPIENDDVLFGLELFNDKTIV